MIIIDREIKTMPLDHMVGVWGQCIVRGFFYRHLQNFVECHGDRVNRRLIDGVIQLAHCKLHQRQNVGTHIGGQKPHRIARSDGFSEPVFVFCIGIGLELEFRGHRRAFAKWLADVKTEFGNGGVDKDHQPSDGRSKPFDYGRGVKECP